MALVYHLSFVFLNQNKSVYQNGVVLTPPVKVWLYRSTLLSFEACMDSVAEKVRLNNGAVMKYVKYNWV